MGIPIFNLSGLKGSDGFRIEGVDEYGGVVVSNAGDLNGDEFDDMVVGSPDVDFSGSAYVVFGKASGFDATFNVRTLDGSNGFRFMGDNDGSMGETVSGGGDVNGDGFEDLIVGARLGGENYDQPAGTSYVLFGKASGFSEIIDGEQLTGNDGFILDGAADNDLAGNVSIAGDVNGDGFDDVIVGATGADPNGDRSGSTYVVFGKASGFDARINLSNLDGNNGFRLDGEAALDLSGSSVGNAGDVNGDGFDDVLIVSPTFDPNGDRSGSSYIVFGKASGFSSTMDLSALDGSNGFRIDGKTGDEDRLFVESANNAGDVNDDGIDDVIVGASGSDLNGNGFVASYVVFGKISGFDATLDLSSFSSTDGFRLNGVSRGSDAGDVNGDGFDDLIVSNPGASPNGFVGAGSSYLIFGKNTGFGAEINVSNLDAADGVRFDGAGAHDRSRDSLSSTGDVNGDGFDDLMIGTFLYSFGGAYTGASYVVFGRSNFGMDHVIKGTSGDDILKGTLGADIFGALEGNDTMFGYAGVDVLHAGAGNDMLNGGADADSMSGAWGNDIYFVDNIGDTVIEKSSEGKDHINSNVTYTLSDNVENLTLTGATAINATGNSQANIITGNNAANQLNGNAGNDTLNGNGGSDTLIGWSGADVMNGGTGNDVYFVENVGDKAIEKLNEGIDTVSSKITYTLFGNVENLTLTGTTAINATGNGLANVITGNSASNQLIGGTGNDIFKFITKGPSDKITDYNVASDTVQLENAAFTALKTTGTLAAGQFRVGAQAADASDFIIYNKTAGTLLYDADGSGATAATQITTIGVGLNMTNTDIVVI